MKIIITTLNYYYLLQIIIKLLAIKENINDYTLRYRMQARDLTCS